MKTALAECFVEVMVATESLRGAVHTNPFVVTDHLDSLREALDIAAERALSMGHEVQNVDLARFAVCAWIDEVLMGLSGAQEAATRSKGLLQRRYYDTADAGALFYEYMQQHAFTDPELREVFELCLCLGFHGAGRPVIPDRDTGTTADTLYPARDCDLSLRLRYRAGTMRLLVLGLSLPVLLYLIWLFMDALIGNAVLALPGSAGG